MHWYIRLVMVALLVIVGSGRFAEAQPTLDDSLLLRRTPVVEVFEKSRDAVVNISSTEIVTVRSPFGGSLFEEMFNMPRRDRQYTRTSVGSGFVIHEAGYIVTNAHVVAGTTERKATFADGREYPAAIIALDESRDLAVLKVEADQSLPPLPIGHSDDLMIGETVIAIGNPLGYQNTVTAGVISAIGRELDLSREMRLEGLIQTDASINLGNSGGPLLNVLGELIGVNTAIRGDAQNIGFAIPVDRLREVLPDLLDIERRYRIVSGLEVDTKNSPRIVSVAAGSPAEQAGFRVGDVLEAVDKQPISEGIDYYINMIGRRSGERLPMRIRRGAQVRDLTLRLRKRPVPDGAKLAQARLGLEVFPLPEDAARDLRLPAGRGLFIGALESDGPADQRGIERQDILIRLGKQEISTVEELGQVLESLKPGQTVPISILRVERRGKSILSGEIRVR